MATYLPDFLKSETFWVAVQSIAAVAGLFVLFAYTLYTKRMRDSTDRMLQLQLDTHRAEIAPVFTLSSLGGSDGGRNLTVGVTNVGKGPALRFKGWYCPVDQTFQLVESKMLTRTIDAEDGVGSVFEVLANDPATMTFYRVDPNRYCLYVVECEDTGGYKHQFQLIHLPEPAAIDPWLMVHGWPA
jgi:hypothetical protein